MNPKKKLHRRALLLVTVATVVLASGLFKDRFFKPVHSPPPLPTPLFDENYAMQVIHDYEAFGPKVPGTPAHEVTGNWILAELKKMQFTVHEQKSKAITFDQKTIPIRNIIAQWNPSAKTRYLLSAHWDNRPFADNEVTRKGEPVPGVNDGGSGVAVLMTIAKSLHQRFPSGPTSDLSIGIDFAFWDAEDWGTPSVPESYCLGSQYWAEHPVPSGYRAEFGINFDMVGRIGSVFPIEIGSEKTAPQVISKLREAARSIGYGDYFPNYRIGPVVDDHSFVNAKLDIPYIDLIYMTPDGRFAPEWHTLSDTSEFISRDVLKGVGQSVLQLLWTY